jgi:hypothetical protein
VRREYIKKTKKAKYLDIRGSDEPKKYNLNTNLRSEVAPVHFLLPEVSGG